MDVIFTQWTDGQPWWLTLLLLPVLVLAAAAVRVARYGLLAAAIASVLGALGVGVWMFRRRRVRGKPQ